MIKSNALLQYHRRNRYFDIFANVPALANKRNHIEGVIKIADAIAQFKHSNVDRELLKVMAEHHDDGRAEQYLCMGKFWDTELDHRYYGGIIRLNNFLRESGLSEDKEIQILRKVMMYHGLLEIMKVEVSEEEREYIEIISAADDFENATSCVSYLIREIDEDAKGYKHDHPELYQKTVTSWKIIDWYEKGEKYDKFKYCHTYADYVLFAGMLAINCIKKYGEPARTALLQPGYGYSSRLEGFRKTFDYALEPKDAVNAYYTMCKAIGVEYTISE